MSLWFLILRDLRRTMGLSLFDGSVTCRIVGCHILFQHGSRFQIPLAEAANQ